MESSITKLQDKSQRLKFEKLLPGSFIDKTPTWFIYYSLADYIPLVVLFNKKNRKKINMEQNWNRKQNY